jgi:mRNA-degrading endonuclease RelE of RelBE toxin-antitoxin system
MKWKINYSRYAENFLKKNDIRDDIRRDLVKFLKKMRGESINIDVKKLKGSWKD